jgi:lipopolysaccharide biosynthesis glycosyltransferase
VRIALYTAYHKAAPLLDSASVRPIHVGAAAATAPLKGMIGDDTGTHISAKNREYCELTALYWAWKNDTDASHIGLMHYRRVIDFSGQFGGSVAEVCPTRFDIPDWLEQTESWLADNAQNYDLIVPRVHSMGQRVAVNYRDGHARQDFDTARQIIARDHAAYLPSFDAVAQGYDLRLGNMFVMSRALLDRYCTWLFDILEQLENTDLDRSHYSPQQCRYLGFVAERLLGVFVHHLQTTEPDLRLIEPAIINLSEALVSPYLADDSLNGPAHINIAVSADRAYLPHTSAMLHSMLTRADQTRQINLFFLHGNIDAQALDMLGEVTRVHPNTHLHLINAGAVFVGSYRSSSRAPSNATYNRFLLFGLLPALDRLLYLDGDMIFHGDVAQIYDTDMGEHQIAAVPDYIMTRTLSGPTPTIDRKVPDLAAYHRDVLGLNDTQIGRYFNAGLLLLNFGAMDVAATGAALMAKADTTQFLFRDQDILNCHFKDSYLPLDGRYNVFNTEIGGYGRVPQANHASAMAARRDPLVTHYAAHDYKPWLPIAVPRAQYYWDALIQTPFYTEVIALQTRATARRLRRKVVFKDRGRAFAEKVPVLRPAMGWVYRRIQRLLS